jgi:uncharacterized pyridoxal phosphate-containing UPF0001 family protein
MTLALFSSDMAKVRPCFALLRRLRDEAIRRNAALTELSMGMSGDFEEALGEGANVVRVGSTCLPLVIPGARRMVDTKESGGQGANL